MKKNFIERVKNHFIGEDIIPTGNGISHIFNRIRHLENKLVNSYNGHHTREKYMSRHQILKELSELDDILKFDLKLIRS